MSFEERYSKLNAAQRQAVDTIDGPVMVIAGPGTGKTELLSMRAANILRKTDTLPENILCLTFTESGAVAMRQRLSTIIGKDAYKVAIHTFHSFGTEVISQNRAHFYHGADFRPADELSSYHIIRTIFDGLPHDNPLASKMNGEYTYLPDTLRAISELKRSGLASDELLAILRQNDTAMDAIEATLADIFAPGIKKTTAEQLAPHIGTIRSSETPSPISSIIPLARILADGLEYAVSSSLETNSTKPITAWRTKWMKKDDHGNFVFKSRDRHTKLRAVSVIYTQYLAAMQAAALYDFDDMILTVLRTIETTPELQFNLQEKYHYIMVDEFQDTNLAQMRMLHNLTNNPVSEGAPNVLVVGDDDQAIYSFQGADVGNIVSFRGLYATTKIITLTDNYRSSQPILEQARGVITQGADRLETRFPDLDKTLTPHAIHATASVNLTEYDTISDERAHLTALIANQIQQGSEPADIAVLARKHSEIEALLPYFAEAGLAVNYERRDNVLELDIIRHLELLGAILVALYESRHEQANALLPQLLSHPAWHIDPVAIWKLSLAAKAGHTSWIEAMAVTPAFAPLHRWLIATSQQVEHLPLERIMDVMLGKVPLGATEPLSQEFTSPLFLHFFAPQNLRDQPDAYLTFLEALRTIRAKLRDYRVDEEPRLQSLLEFIALHRQLGTTITSLRPSTSHLSGAVNLMTSHKSKGLEFDTVYIVGAIDTTWGERVRSRVSMLSYPENLQLSPSGGSLDERLRLFFVAMTRAKRQLFISYSKADDNGKNILPASFLLATTLPATPHTTTHTIDTLVRAAELRWYQPLVNITSGTMQELLAPLLSQYKLSATHVGAFLDVTRGGPQAFLLDYLLRFPQAKPPQAAYGTAVHATLQRAHAHLSATDSHRAPEDILHDFETNLREQHLPEDQFQLFLQKGSDALQVFLQHNYASFTPGQKAELDFAAEQSIVGQAHLTGSLDLVDIDHDTKTITVTDYKTGKPVRDWKGKTDYEKIKLHRYRQQLMFYKLLVEHSRNFNRFTVTQGVLQFVEPTSTGDIIGLTATFSSEELAHFSQLLQKIWQHITTLTLPDTSNYTPDYKGILAFEADLLEIPSPLV